MSSGLACGDYADIWSELSKKSMIEGNRFAVPPEIEEILDHLPPHVTLNVPDHILSIWFPPGPVDGRMEGPALTRAQAYAQSCGCKFDHHQETGEGIFYKPIPSED
jgi:hypothetical protein